ncbi:LOW QUALITY PROTEIN: hypothetical protein HID58_013354, partial [Brassica napus]
GNDGSCTHRNESPPLPQNYFITNPNATQACADNSSPLIRMMTTCHEAAGKRWPIFRSDGGGAAEAANGRLTCGCDSLSLCKFTLPYKTFFLLHNIEIMMNVLYIYICTTTFGTCDAPPPKAAPKPAAGGESTRNPSDLPAGHAVSTGTGGLSSLVMISVATLLLWWLFVIEL